MRNPRRKPTRKMFEELTKHGVRFKLKHPAGVRNPAGTKLYVRAFKAAHGVEPDTESSR